MIWHDFNQHLPAPEYYNSVNLALVDCDAYFTRYRIGPIYATHQ